MKLKYRIILENRSYPYRVQKKGFIFWNEVASSDSLDSAKKKMVELCRCEAQTPEGTVLATYSSEDLLADKLRGVQ